MVDVPFMPPLGEGGLRPRINVNRLSNSFAKMVEKHEYGDCEQFSKYKKLSVISKGKSCITKVVDLESGKKYASKTGKLFGSIDSEKNFCSEIEILREMSHPNIITYEGMVAHPKLTHYCILLEYCQENLTQLLNSFRSPFDESQLKCVMTMLLSGLVYLHEHNIIHRDIAPQNLLISSVGILKIGDFGKAVKWEEEDEEKLECNVGTPGYRAVELIVSHQKYTPAIDMWSVGCIFAELLLHRPLFSSEDINMYQIYDIVQLCGSTVTSASTFSTNSCCLESLKVERPEAYCRVFKDTKPSAVNLLKKFFKYDFTQRIKASEVISEEYFTTQPVASDPLLLEFYLDYKRRSVDGPCVSEIAMDQIVEATLEKTDIATRTVICKTAPAETGIVTHAIIDVATNKEEVSLEGGIPKTSLKIKLNTRDDCPNILE